MPDSRLANFDPARPKRPVGVADDSPLATQLARDLSLSGAVTNWLCWWSAIEKATLADFPRLALLAKANPTALKLVAERWAQVAPLHFFQTLVDASKSGAGLPGELPRLLFDTWLKREPDAAIAALENTEDFPRRADWRREVASAVIQQNPEQGLKLFSEWHIENYGPDMKGIQSWAAANPRHAAEFAIANPAGYATTIALQMAGEEWARTAPEDALNFALAQNGQPGSIIAKAALQTWATRDLNAAAAWLASADPATREEFSPPVVEAWAKQDPSSALAWCESNLAGTSLAQAVGGVFKGAAEKDQLGAAQLVAGMPPSPSRAEAAGAVASRWFPSFVATDKPVPPESIAWLSSLDPASIRRVLNEVSWQWAEADPSSMANFLRSVNGTEVPSYTYSILGKTMARKNPMDALAWADQLPDGRGVDAGSAAFSEWARSQPDFAMNWWSALAANDPRRQPFYESVVQQFAWDSQATAQFSIFSALDPEAARKVIGDMHLDEQRRCALMNLISQR